MNAQSHDVPTNYGRVEVALPAGTSAERIDARRSRLSPFSTLDATRARGDQWLSRKQSLVLFVPAQPVRGLEYNVLINPLHPEFAQLTCSPPEPISWDLRLFPQAAAATK